MNLSEAKQNAKDLNETLAVLITASEGMKDADFAAMQKRKDAMEGAIADAHKRLVEASNDADEKVAKVKADADAQLADFKKQIKDAENVLAAVRVEGNVQRETMRESIASERASLLKASQEAVWRLDSQIVQKQKTLGELNAAIEAARARFA